MQQRAAVRPYITRQRDTWGVTHLTAYEALWLRRIGDLEGPFADDAAAEAAAHARTVSPYSTPPALGVETLLGT